MGFALTIIEILIAFILIVGFVCEEKLAAFEQRVVRFVKRKIRKAMRKSRGDVRVVSASSLSRTNKYCA